MRVPLPVWTAQCFLYHGQITTLGGSHPVRRRLEGLELALQRSACHVDFRALADIRNTAAFAVRPRALPLRVAEHVLAARLIGFLLQILFVGIAQDKSAAGYSNLRV